MSFQVFRGFLATLEKELQSFDEPEYDKDEWEKALLELRGKVEKGANLPRHVAIIMDGNRRWAKSRGLHPVMGHKAGVSALKDVVAGAKDIGIKVLSVYAFSKENWKRSDEEIQGLFFLFKFFIKKEVPELKEKGVRLSFIGDIEELPQDLQEAFRWGEEETAEGKTLHLNVFVNYSGKWDLLQAVKAILRRGLDPDQLTEETFSSFLALRDEPDLLLRTSGELRISNFLIWQSAYSELYFTKKLWPDFTRFDLLEAVKDYMRRQRRFGA